MQHTTIWWEAHQQRLTILDDIEIIKAQYQYENEERRVALREQIERLGSLITWQRAEVAAGSEIDTMMVEAIRFANRERARNRQRVKFLAAKLTEYKRRLLDINRAISKIESESSSAN